jgi:hypothetical protein
MILYWKRKKSCLDETVAKLEPVNRLPKRRRWFLSMTKFGTGFNCEGFENHQV